MDRDKLIERLMTTFLGELEEHVQNLNRDLLALEKEPEGPERSERIKELFRAAHSLKGAARSVNVGLVEDACHQLETILAQVREGRTPLDPDLFALLFSATDALEEAGMRLREQQDFTGSPLAALLPRLKTAVEALAAPAPVPEDESPASTAPPAPAPTAPPAPAPPPAASEQPPTLEEQEATASALPPTSPTPAAAEKTSGSVAFVRVSAEKLDVLLALSGELLVARRRVESRTGDLVTLREFVGRWRSEWRGIERPLDVLLTQGGNGNAGQAHFRAGVNAAPPRPAVALLRRTGDSLNRLERDLERLTAALASDQLQLDRAASLLDEEVRRARMLPFSEACQGLERVVRDVAQLGGKQVDLNIQGGAVELDRSILEGLRDPLNHLVRNAVDHGIEPPERRRELGKPPQGRVTVSAALRGIQVEVVVADDGRGLDWEALRAAAQQRGLLTSSEDPRDLTAVIFLPGVSTASTVTSISGRGVGLDVVKNRLEQLHGAIDLTATAGQGTRFVLVVPLTLTTLRALLVIAGGQVFAFATTNVQQLVRVGPGAFRSVGGREMLMLEGAPIPVASLAHVLGLPAPEPAQGDGKRPALILAVGERRMALLVDELWTEQEIVVKGLGARIRRVRNVAGATILPSGQVALVMHAAHLVRTALAGAVPTPHAPTTAPGAAAPRKRLLVVDDSVTTRTLEKSILEAADYDVGTAVDGEDAWRLLHEQKIDLVVADIEMPRMDGFALTEAIRRSNQFADLPVVLLTSRTSEPDRTRGVEVGANAYLVKSAFDQQELLATIAQLL